MRSFIFTAACAAALLYHAPALAQSDDAATSCRPIALAEPAARASGARATSPPQMWALANGAARQRPERDGFEAARYVYTYAPGSLYELYANPNFISTILLEEGETLEDVAAGDTSRWQVSETTTDGALGPRTIVLVKPAATGLRTNIVLVTDRRTYLVEAQSQASEAYSAQIAWCYPERAAAIASTANAAALNFDYRVRVIRGARPAWAPIRVFDDGRRTWVEFAAMTAASELPPLFVITPEGAELTNCRVDGRRYMVDRVFDAAELRLGVRAPIIVRIERTRASPSPRRTRRGRP